jgi:hypothetical protein
VKAGDIIVNSGDTPLRQIDIHANPKFVTEWLTRIVGRRRQRAIDQWLRCFNVI